MVYQGLKKRIKKNEGFSVEPYKDQLGFTTIGYGHLILKNEKHLIQKKTTKNELEIIFENDFKKAVNNYKNFFKDFCSDKKDAELLIEMIFQLGPKGVLGFEKLLNNMINKNKHLVCFEMMNSLWYSQTPNRVKTLIKNFLKK